MPPITLAASAMQIPTFLCPAIISRLGGVERAILLTPSTVQSRRLLQEFELQKQRQASLLSDISALIERTISNYQGNAKIRLIQLRRDIYNLRLPKAQREASELFGFPQEFTSALKEFFLEFEHAARARRDTILHIENQIQKALGEIFSHLLSSDASKGLVLSSPNLISRFTRESLGAPGGKLNQNAYTLIQYATRCATKTSPFSFFSPTAFGWITVQTSRCQLNPVEYRPVSHASINSSWLAQISEDLKKRQNSNGSPQTSYTWNRSLIKDGEQILWLAQSHDRDTIRSLILKEGSPYHDILNSIAQSSIPPPSFDPKMLPSDVQAQFRAYGILTEVKPSRDDRPLIAPQALSDVKAFDNANERYLAPFRIGDIECRMEMFAALIKNIGSALRDPAISVDSEPGRRTVSPLLYKKYVHSIREDVVLTNKTQMDLASANDLSTSLSRFLRAFDSIMPENACRFYVGYLMTEAFPGRARVPLLSFLRLLFIRVSTIRKSDGKSPEFILNLLTELAQKNAISPPLTCETANLQTIADKIASSDSASHEIQIPDDLLTPAKLVPSASGILGAIVQPFGMNGDSWVVNNLGIGSGRVIRRWLKYDPNFQNAVRKWAFDMQQPWQADSIDVSLIDDIIFPGDEDPRLFNTYLAIPGVKDIPEGLPIQLSECYLSTDDDGFAILIHKTGKRIYTHYENILAVNVRPWITQFLCLFGRIGWSFSLTSLYRILDNLTENHRLTAHKPAIRYSPRLTLESGIVIRRRKWTVPANLFPTVSDTASLEILIGCYRSWQQSLSLPDQIYLHFPSNNNSSRSTERQDAYKPQFIDFRSPLFLVFLHKIFRKGEGSVCIEEALPNPLPSEDGSQPRVSEHILHWVSN